MGKVSIFILLAVVALLSLPQHATAHAKAKVWSDEDLERLEQQWAMDDDEDELKTEGQLLMEKIDRLNAKGEDPTIDPLVDPESFVRMQQQQSQGKKGPVMMFATVKRPKGTNHKDSNEGGYIQSLARKWTEMLQLGGVQAQLYVIESDQLLASLPLPRDAQELKAFLLTQPETLQVTWDSQNYYPDTKAARKYKRKQEKKQKTQESMDPSTLDKERVRQAAATYGMDNIKGGRERKRRRAQRANAGHNDKGKNKDEL